MMTRPNFSRILPLFFAATASTTFAPDASTTAGAPDAANSGPGPFFVRPGAMLGRRPPLPFGNCMPAPRGRNRQHGPKDGVARTTGELRRLERRAKLAEAERFAFSKSDARRFRATCAAALRHSRSAFGGETPSLS